MMREPISVPVAELVPHSGAMSLLERVVEADSESLVAEVVVRDNPLFCYADTVGAWVGIEYMAQAIAAWLGCEARKKNLPPRVGFLLGTRRYTSMVPVFNIGEQLQIEVQLDYLGENKLGLFNCWIRSPEGTELARASLTVFEPENAQEFMQQGRKTHDHTYDSGHRL